MSASLIYNLGPAMLLMSDGCAYRNGEITRLDARKVWKLSETVGLMWMGAFVDPMDKVINPQKGKTAKDAIHDVAKILESIIKGNSAQEDYLNDNNPYNVFTFEYRNGELHRWRLFWVEDRFTPKYKGVLKPGSYGILMVSEDDNKGAMKLFKELMNQNTDGNFNTVEDAVIPIKKSFSEMVKKYNEQGVHVGGKIFTDIITKT